MSRALTLWPEWAWAIHNLDKRVENRGWPIPLGEWFALHAGKNIGGRPGATACDEGLMGLVDMAERAGWDARLIGVDANWTAIFDKDGRTVGARGSHGDFTYAPIPTSAIVGLFRVTRHDAPNTGDLGGWRVFDAVANRIDYRPLTEPVPCKGAQGLWTVPPDVAALVRARVTPTQTEEPNNAR